MITKYTKTTEDNAPKAEGDSVQTVVSDENLSKVKGQIEQAKSERVELRRQEGAKSSINGESPINCPYEYGSEERKNWVAGWRSHKESTGVNLS